MGLANILVVEDDKNITKLIRYNLEKEGFTCNTVITAEDAYKALSKEPVHLILLDIMLPRMNGFEFCKQLRQDEHYSEIPVIMLTARGEEVDRVIGFELGADDYIVKPFSPRELILRIKAVMKRGGGGAKETVSKEVVMEGPIKLDVPRHFVSVDGKEIKLTAMEFKLLSLLMQRCGRVQSRDNLLKDVWDLDPDLNTRTIDTHIKRLRQKLGDANVYIETIRGYGYRFKEDAESK